MAQVVVGRRELGRDLVVGQHRARVVDLEVDHLRDAERVGQGLRELREEGCHLVGALHVEFGAVEAHAPRLVALLARADAQEQVVRLGVAALEVVHVVRADEGEPRAPRDGDEALVRDLLLRYAVVLQLEVVVPGAEQLRVAHRRRLGLGFLPHEHQARDLARDAGRARDEALRVRREELEVDARLVVVAFRVRGRAELEEVPVPIRVLREEDEVIILVAVLRPRALEARAARDVELLADDGLDALLPAGVVELDGAEHIAVVGQGQGGHA